MNTTDSIPTARPSWLVTLLCLLVVIGGAFGAIALFGNSSADAATPATQKIVIRPVTASGHAAKGFKVITDNRPAIVCLAESDSAVNGGIDYCGGSGDDTASCWRSATKGRVLCLNDIYTHNLHSIRLKGIFKAEGAPRHATPQALTLSNGQQFFARNGGHYGVVSAHPDWLGAYAQRHGSMHKIFGPEDHPINMRHKAWFVTTFLHRYGQGVRHDVTTAYYVGTAR